MAVKLKNQLQYNAGRNHSEFVEIIPMSNEEFKGKIKPLMIYYSIVRTPIGKMFVANTSKGICFLSFFLGKRVGIEELTKRYPNAQISEKSQKRQDQINDYFSRDWDYVKPLHLHIKGTPFQLMVWEELLKIPLGKITTYGNIAKNIGNNKSSRAVGKAASFNPVMFFIPCHRIIKANGKLGGYYWGIDTKINLLNLELFKHKKIEGYITWQPILF